MTTRSCVFPFPSHTRSLPPHPHPHPQPQVLLQCGKMMVLDRLLVKFVYRWAGGLEGGAGGGGLVGVMGREVRRRGMAAWGGRKGVPRCAV